MKQPVGEGFGEYEDRGSRFLGYAFPMRDEAAFEAKLEEVRAEHPKARHHCWAWRVHPEYRFNDDGEPGGTAGRPMLQVLEGQEWTRIGVIVVRYFGGVKLGTGGLARAYSGAAQRALAETPAEELRPKQHVALELPFDLSGLRNELQTVCPSLEWSDGEFSDSGWRGEVVMDVRDYPAFESLLSEKGAGRTRWSESGTSD